jgi:hypothetical protein
MIVWGSIRQVPAAGGVAFIVLFGHAGVTRRFAMKLRDLFVPRWNRSNPEVRKKAIARIDNLDLLKRISEKDEDPMVREAASDRLLQIVEQERQIAE